MAHFAELDQSNAVLRVIVVANDMLLDNGVESESKGIAFCQQLFGANTRWVQTSYSGSFRKNYASTGFTYGPVLDAFIPPKPDGDYWVLDPNTCAWLDPEFEKAKSRMNIGVSNV